MYVEGMPEGASDAYYEPPERTPFDDTDDIADIWSQVIYFHRDGWCTDACNDPDCAGLLDPHECSELEAQVMERLGEQA